MTNVLFVCAANRLRSPTAEHVFADWPGIHTDSAGTNANAEVLLSSEQVEWADIIFVMEKRHKTIVSKRYARLLGQRRVVCLDIPDRYAYLQPELVALLERRVAPFLRAHRPASAAR